MAARDSQGNGGDARAAREATTRPDARDVDTAANNDLAPLEEVGARGRADANAARGRVYDPRHSRSASFSPHVPQQATQVGYQPPRQARGLSRSRSAASGVPEHVALRLLTGGPFWDAVASGAAPSAFEGLLRATADPFQGLGRENSNGSSRSSASADGAGGRGGEGEGGFDQARTTGASAGACGDLSYIVS
ncbi:unnamed protein product [Ostreobium quekettii]|uniref:Uncharacterized protein n=1 Tax=Ostreobium quekettii TaxID=121088 RepID=A0A8S1JAF3_9CHLO|nr:unnamed protein product [Ostreobium quekettii]|eukprot:evm.model.scf_420.3 EVM.evm.TU.scf_420.3   scf_420:43177-44124(-)